MSIPFTIRRVSSGWVTSPRNKWSSQFPPLSDYEMEELCRKISKTDGNRIRLSKRESQFREELMYRKNNGFEMPFSNMDNQKWTTSNRNFVNDYSSRSSHISDVGVIKKRRR